MRRDSRLSGILHVLLHMAEHSGPITSEALGRMMGTNPVVIRRILGGLRDQGYVRSDKGHGGGWVLTCDLHQITLRDIYEAIGEPALFAIGHRSEAPDCLVEQAVNAALDDNLARAREMMLARMGEVTLAMLSADFHARAARRGVAFAGDHAEHGHER